jgi:endonuclease/exonuclease/phosphatase family metal-dependent hydrolase
MANVVCSSHRGGRFVGQLAASLIASGCLAAVASADTTVTLSTPGTHINADQTIQGGTSGFKDFSNDDSLSSKASSDVDYDRRIVLKFDTQNYIPANAIIKSAQLQLVLQSAASSESRPLTIFNVTRSFTSGEVNWYYAKTGSKWSTSGGDLGSSYGTVYVGNSVGSIYKFDITKIVQHAVSGDYGSSRYTRIALIDRGSSSGNSYKAFHSTRSTNGSARPRLVITYATSSSTTTSGVTTSSAGTTLRVMQWNVHKTKGSDGICNPDRIASQIVKQNPQVVSLNEVNFYSGDCAYTFDMGAKLESLLEQKTGVTWNRKNVNVDGGSTGYGNVVLSRLPLVSSSSTLLSYQRGVAHVGVVVNGRTINLYSTHVDYANASYRTTQTHQVVSYVDNYSNPRITMGDFNTNPGTSDYNIMESPYQDAWAAAKSAGTATSYNGTGATHGTSRFDYVYYSRNSGLVLKSVNVPDTRVNGVYSSDHDPVVAVFGVQ